MRNQSTVGTNISNFEKIMPIPIFIPGMCIRKGMACKKLFSAAPNDKSLIL